MGTTNRNFETFKTRLDENEIYTRMRLHKVNPNEYSLPTNELIKDLKYEQLEKLRNQVVKVNYVNEKPFISTDGQLFEVEIPMESKAKLKFERKYKGKIFYCTCTIKYTKEIDVLSLHDVKPLEIINALGMWKSFLKETEETFSNNKRILNRLDAVIRILGLKPETLLLREKFLLLARLLPLVEKIYSYGFWTKRKR